MVRFLRKWLVPLLAGVMLLGIAAAFVPFSRQMETRAKAELTLLMDRAFARIAANDRMAEPMIEAEEESLLSKAVAVARFLEHDDALLAGDALSALCEQLRIDRIDVADIEGKLVASSDTARIGLALGDETDFAWAMAAADDPSAALTQADKTDVSVLYACVGRSDIEGFVLLTRNDTHVASALMRSDAESLTSDLPYGGDILFPAEQGGVDGFFYESGNLCLRRTEDGVSMIAARPTTEVYAVRNAALLAFGAALVILMICGVAAYLLHLEPVAAEEGEEQAQEERMLDSAEQERMLQQRAALEQPRERPKKPRKRRPPEEREQPEEEPQVRAQVEAQHEQALDRAPRQVARGKKKPSHSEDDSESAFEKIVD